MTNPMKETDVYQICASVALDSLIADHARKQAERRELDADIADLEARISKLRNHLANISNYKEEGDETE